MNRMKMDLILMQQRSIMKISARRNRFFCNDTSRYIIKIKGQINSVYCSNKSIDRSGLVKYDLPPKMSNESLNIISASFSLSTENQSK